jgi:hypothetical protein
MLYWLIVVLTGTNGEYKDKMALAAVSQSDCEEKAAIVKANFANMRTTCVAENQFTRKKILQ